MLMYECLSLNHPFSRNKRDHSRELLLHGWRPSLTEQVNLKLLLFLIEKSNSLKELSSPTLILDLMVACWSEDPNDRPSAKDIAQLTNSLEYRHLMDIIEISSNDEYRCSNCLAAISYREINETDEDNDELGIPTADCWFIRQSKQYQQTSMVIVAYDQFNAVNQQVRNFEFFSQQQQRIHFVDFNNSIFT